MRYPYTDPVTGISLEWEPLSIGQSLELAAQHKNNDTMMGPALLIARIKKYGEREGAPTAAEWRSWPDVAYEMFAEEIQEKEAARKAMFRKKKVGELEGVEATFQGAILKAQEATAELGRALTALLEAHEIQKSVKDPLG